MARRCRSGSRITPSRRRSLTAWVPTRCVGICYRVKSPWNSIRFSKIAIQEAQREFLIRLNNVYSFFVIYANIDRFDPQTMPAQALKDRALLDRWILGELNQTIADATRDLDAFENATAANRISEFVDALSNWYVRRSRDRFWASGFSEDKRAACWTLYECLVTLSKVLGAFYAVPRRGDSSESRPTGRSRRSRKRASL